MAATKYKLVVGDNLEVTYANDDDSARNVAMRLCKKYPGVTVVAFDTQTNASAFTYVLGRVRDCPDCE